MNHCLYQGGAILKAVPHYLQQIPEDLVWSMGIGVVICGAFLAFGNTKKPFIDGLTPSTQAKEASKETGNEESANDSAKKAKDEALERLKRIGEAASSNGIGVKKREENLGDKDAVSQDSVDVVVPAGEKQSDIQLDKDDKEIMAKIKKFQQDWNVSDDTVKEAIQKTVIQQSQGIEADLATSMEGPAISWIRMLDIAVLIALISIGAYWLNLKTNGDAGRVVMNMFPREMKTLGLDKYLNDFTAVNE